MTTRTLETLAVVFSATIIVGWCIYWGVQVGDVLDLLELANAP